ncbi:hypothetical protein [Fodinicola acaciae]|uniref:hypothetical protein n=1 Tax=Fodinicola acaciae TaxID=2681555 RepID=UPI0013D0139B|nr:hypothetical protein [Fodinicola acaciae]
MTDEPPAEERPLLTATPQLVKTAIEQLQQHQPISRKGKSICRRCCQPWTCEIHQHAEEVIVAAGLRLADFDSCAAAKPKSDTGLVVLDTSQPRPRSHRQSPQPKPRVQLRDDGSMTVTVTPVGTATMRLPRIRPD